MGSGNSILHTHDYSVSIFCALSCIHKQYIILRTVGGKIISWKFSIFLNFILTATIPC